MTRCCWRPLAQALGSVLVAAGCGGGVAPELATSSDPANAAAGFQYADAAAAEQTACAALDADTVGVTAHWRWDVDRDSLRAVIDSLESRMASASDADLAPLLLALGRSKTPYRPLQGTPEAKYATDRPDEYWANEIGGDWLYQGTDLKELIRRFPGSELVDDAAYALTLLPRGGECEGYVPCYIAWEWQPVSEFLRSYPESPFADSAVDRALAAFRAAQPDVDPRVASEFLDPADLRALVASLDSVARPLPAPRRARLLERAGVLWTRFADYDRARASYDAALSDSVNQRPANPIGAASAEPSLTACIAARRAALPETWFTLAPAAPIHPARVELHWTPPPDARSYVVRRSRLRADSGAVLARLDASAVSWTDTTTTASTPYWYRIEAVTPGARMTSNAAPVRTPGLRVRVRGAAVSTEDRRLHLFGVLDNGFPQVLSIGPDGSSIERDDARFIGFETGERYEHALDAYTDAVWLPDLGGIGVLRFPRDSVADRGVVGVPRTARDSAAVPAPLFHALRKGADLLSGDVDGRRYLLAVDQPAGAAWLERGGGGAGASTVMDCDARTNRCWHGREAELTLRDSAATLRTVRLPGSGSRLTTGSGLHMDPIDGSAWLLHAQSGRLLHFDTTGAALHEIDLAGSGGAYAVVLAADLDRRTFWFTRRGAQPGLDLVRLDIAGPSPRETVLRSDVRGLPHLVPDLEDGVWLVDHEAAWRVDRDGAILVRVPIDGSAG